MLPYNETALYIEDWIGLRTLDESGKLEFLTSPGGHLQFTNQFFFNIVDKYLKSWIDPLYVFWIKDLSEPSKEQEIGINSGKND